MKTTWSDDPSSVLLACPRMVADAPAVSNRFGFLFLYSILAIDNSDFPGWVDLEIMTLIVDPPTLAFGADTLQMRTKLRLAQMHLLVAVLAL